MPRGTPEALPQQALRADSREDKIIEKGGTSQDKSTAYTQTASMTAFERLTDCLFLAGGLNRSRGSGAPWGGM